MPEGFVENWDRLIRDEPGRQVEFGGGHPLRLMYGSDKSQRPLFFVISDLKPGLVSLSDAVAVDRGVRSVDGKWTLSLTLLDSRFTTEFMRVGNELVDSTSEGYNEAHSLQLFVEAIRHWKALFTYSPPQHLSKPQIRGLIGEMWFGFERLVQSFEPKTVLNGWGGPLDSPQDFNLQTGQTYEVKTVYSDTKAVKISSAEQLDVDNRVLELAVVTLADVDERTLNAISLPTLVQKVDDSLDLDDREGLQKRLRRLEVDISDTYYTDFWFRVDSCTTYRVDASFPALRRRHLSPVIENVHYEVELYGIADYVTSTWTHSDDASVTDNADGSSDE